MSVIQLDQAAWQLIALINQYRKSKGHDALRPQVNLKQAAVVLNTARAASNTFGHSLPDGTSTFQVIRDNDYWGNSWLAEVLSGGQGNAWRAFLGLKGSPTHNAAILNDAYRDIGASVSYTAGNKYEWLWTVEMGAAYINRDNPHAEYGAEWVPVWGIWTSDVSGPTMEFYAAQLPMSVDTEEPAYDKKPQILKAVDKP